MVKKIICLSFFLFVLLAFGSELLAQCPMCRMAVESNLQDGGTAGKGLNNGILYMLMMPYVLVGTIGFIWYRSNKKREEMWAQSSFRR